MTVCVCVCVYVCVCMCVSAELVRSHKRMEVLPAAAREGLYCHARPSLRATVVCVLQPGDVLDVTGTHGQWLRVQLLYFATAWVPASMRGRPTCQVVAHDTRLIVPNMKAVCSRLLESPPQWLAKPARPLSLKRQRHQGDKEAPPLPARDAEAPRAAADPAVSPLSSPLAPVPSAAPASSAPAATAPVPAQPTALAGNTPPAEAPRDPTTAPAALPRSIMQWVARVGRGWRAVRDGTTEDVVVLALESMDTAVRQLTAALRDSPQHVATAATMLRQANLGSVQSMVKVRVALGSGVPQSVAAC